MPLAGVKQNPYATREDLRRMSLTLNELVKRANGAVNTVQILSVSPNITGDITLTDEYSVIPVDASGGNITVTLPAAGSGIGTVYYIKKIDSSSNTVTIDANASETIDGVTTKVISSQYVSTTIVQTATQWWII